MANEKKEIVRKERQNTNIKKNRNDREKSNNN